MSSALMRVRRATVMAISESDASNAAQPKPMACMIAVPSKVRWALRNVASTIEQTSASKKRERRARRCLTIWSTLMLRNETTPAKRKAPPSNPKRIDAPSDRWPVMSCGIVWMRTTITQTLFWMFSTVAYLMNGYGRETPVMSIIFNL